MEALFVVTVIIGIAVAVFLAVKLYSLSDEVKILRQRMDNIKPEITYTPQNTEKPPVSENRTVYVPPAVGAYKADKPDYNRQIAQQDSPEKSYENFIGGRLFAVLAAILVFIGMIFLAATAFSRFGNAGRLGIMIFAAVVVTAAGIFLIKRGKNAFTTALAGGGLALFLIPIFYSYFVEFIDFPVMLALLLVWGAVLMIVSKIFDAPSLTIFSHIGLTISFLVIAFSEAGMDFPMMWLFIAFECILSVLILSGGKIISKKVNISAFISIGIILLFTVLLVINSSAVDIYSVRWRERVWTPAFVNSVYAYIVQFIICVVLSIAVCFVLEKSDVTLNTVRLVQIFYGIVFVITAFMVSGILLKNLLFLSGSFSQVIFISIMTIAVASLIVLAVYRMKKRDDNKFYTVAAVILLGVLFIMMFMIIDAYPYSKSIFKATFFLPAAFGSLLLYNKMRAFKPLLVFGVASVFADYIIMLGEGFSDLSRVTPVRMIPSLIYLALYFVFAYCLYKTYPKTKNSKETIAPIRLVTLILSEYALIRIFTDNMYSTGPVISMILLCIIGTIIWCIYANLKYRTPAQTVFLCINEAALLSLSFYLLLTDYDLGMGIILLFFAAIFAFFRVSLIFTRESGVPETIYSAVKCAAVILAAVYFFGLRTDYIFSIIIIILGLLYIIGGFNFKNKTLRHAGLVTSIIAVLKMTIVDVMTSESLVRIFALVIGGVICFAISAIYNTAAKKLIHTEVASENLTDGNLETEAVSEIQAGGVLSDSAESEPSDNPEITDNTGENNENNS
jgi:uncharacterized membrane protein